MSGNYSYNKTELSHISDTLSGLFAEMNQEGSEYQYARTVNGNMVILTSLTTKLMDVEALIQSLALLHPSRFFVLSQEENQNGLRAEVAAICHGLSKTEHVCAEVVRLAFPSSKSKALPNLLRANILPGLPTEIFLCDAEIDSGLLKSLLGLSEKVYLDSSDFSTRSDLLQLIYEESLEIIDFQWVRLGNWRDQVRVLFDKALVASQIEQLSRVEITYNPAHKEGTASSPAFCSLLFAGWICERLQLEPLHYRDQQFTCEVDGSEHICIKLLAGKPTALEQLDKVNLCFNAVQGDSISVRLERQELLHAFIDAGSDKSFHVSRPFEEESRSGSLHRYFSIGESFVNYASALENALRLYDLCKAA